MQDKEGKLTFWCTHANLKEELFEVADMPLGDDLRTLADSVGIGLSDAELKENFDFLTEKIEEAKQSLDATEIGERLTELFKAVMSRTKDPDRAKGAIKGIVRHILDELRPVSQSVADEFRKPIVRELGNDYIP